MPKGLADLEGLRSSIELNSSTPDPQCRRINTQRHLPSSRTLTLRFHCVQGMRYNNRDPDRHGRHRMTTPRRCNVQSGFGPPDLVLPEQSYFINFRKFSLPGEGSMLVCPAKAEHDDPAGSYVPGRGRSRRARGSATTIRRYPRYKRVIPRRRHTTNCSRDSSKSSLLTPTPPGCSIGERGFLTTNETGQAREHKGKTTAKDLPYST